MKFVYAGLSVFSLLGGCGLVEAHGDHDHPDHPSEEIPDHFFIDDTANPPVEDLLAMLANVARVQRERAQFRRPPPSYDIEVRFHHMKSDASEDNFDQSVLESAVEALNTHFTSPCLNFIYQYNVNDVEHVNPTWTSCPSYDLNRRSAMGAQFGVANDLRIMHVFICNPGGLGSILGYAAMPWYSPLNDGFDSDSYKNLEAIYLSYDALETSQYVLSHEAGHWLGLSHTFANDCDFPGDGVDDTPYENTFGDPTNLFYRSCDGTEDTCPDDGQGPDDVNNMMTYTNCADDQSFTQGQLELACAVYEIYRFNIEEAPPDNTQFCHFWYEIDFDSNPEQVGLYVESNGIFYETIVPGVFDSSYSGNTWISYDYRYGNPMGPIGDYSFAYEGTGTIIIVDEGGDGIPNGEFRLDVALGTGFWNRDAYATQAYSVAGEAIGSTLTINFSLDDNCNFQLLSSDNSAPADSPSLSPSHAPSISSKPSLSPTVVPTESLKPSSSPTSQPSLSLNPSFAPTENPSLSMNPSRTPTVSLSQSSDRPSAEPSPAIIQPSSFPSGYPTSEPSTSELPSFAPTVTPTLSLKPSDHPTGSPSDSIVPSAIPSMSPSLSSSPSESPTTTPSVSPQPSASPSVEPSLSVKPSGYPTTIPSHAPTKTPAQGATMESMVVENVGSTSASRVSLTGTYTNPIPVCSVVYPSGSTPPAVVRMMNVAPTSFEIQLQNPGTLLGESGGLSAMTVNCVVVEEGRWTMPGGVLMEAHALSTDATFFKGNWVGEAQTLVNTYTTPVVLGQVMTSNDSRWSTFFSRAESNRRTSPQASSLRVGKHVGEDPDRDRASETIGFIVIEAGNATSDGLQYEAQLGTDTVQGYQNRLAGYEYEFSPLFFESTPSVSIVSQSAMDGNDGGWAVLKASSAISITVLVDEDQLSDSERSHTTEEIAYFAIDQTGQFLLEEAPISSRVSSNSSSTTSDPSVDDYDEEYDDNL